MTNAKTPAPDAGGEWLRGYLAGLPRSSSSKTPEELYAEAEIHELLVRYTVCYDARDYEGALSTFTPDATYETAFGRFVGHDGLRENYARMRGILARTVHGISNVTITLRSPELAWASSYLHAQVLRHDGFTYANVGSYEDQIEKRDGRWLIASRVVTDALVYRIEAIDPAARLGAAGDQPSPD